MGIDGVNNNPSIRPLYTPQPDNTEVVAKVNEELKSAKQLAEDTYEPAELITKTGFSLAGHQGSLELNSDSTFNVEIAGLGKGTFQLVPDGKGGTSLETQGEIDPELKAKLDEHPMLKMALGAAYVARTLKQGGTIPIVNKKVGEGNLKVEVGLDKAKISYNVSF